MDQPIKSNKVFVVEGGMVGRLTVGPLVFNVREHPLFVQTPYSYVKQGRLRECTCTCGEIRLIAERVLEAGRIQSCGCLKQERSRMAQIRKSTSALTAEARKRISQEIQAEQKRLKYYLTQNPKDEGRISQITQRIKELMLQRLSTVNFKYNAKQRIRRREQKLLEEAESLMDQGNE